MSHIKATKVHSKGRPALAPLEPLNDLEYRTYVLDRNQIACERLLECLRRAHPERDPCPTSPTKTP